MDNAMTNYRVKFHGDLIRVEDLLTRMTAFVPNVTWLAMLTLGTAPDDYVLKVERGDPNNPIMLKFTGELDYSGDDGEPTVVLNDAPTIGWPDYCYAHQKAIRAEDADRRVADAIAAADRERLTTAARLADAVELAAKAFALSITSEDGTPFEIRVDPEAGL